MFGFVLVVIGGYLVFKSNWLGLIAVVVGLPMLFAVVGIQIDLDQKLYREFYGLLNFRFGKWQQLPPIDYITIYVERYGQRGSVASIDNVSKYSKVKVSLIAEKNIRYDAGFFDTKEKALRIAIFLAKTLNTKLLDYTTRDPRWIKL
jgi:hypothetical protein